MKVSTMALVATIFFSAPLHAQLQDSAEAIFDRYQSLESSFDPDVADLYCDTALIRNVRTYPFGYQKTFEIPAPQYKELIRSAMPLAKQRGDYSTYSEVDFAPEGKSVRITAIRYSVSKQYSSPISLLVGPCDGGDWAVLEELSQSQP